MNTEEYYRSLLSDYADGALDPAAARDMEAHLAGCPACSAEYRTLQSLLQAAHALPKEIQPARDLWGGIDARIAPMPQDQRAGKTARSASWSTWPLRIAASVVLFGFAAAAYHLFVPAPVAGWEVVRLEGAPHIDNEQISDEGTLHRGDVLQTDRTSRARVMVAGIGNVEVEPNTRLRLVGTDSADRRIVLERGTIRARISAPPRSFVVETPSAVTTDLGGAYTLCVDSTGSSTLTVSTGWVSLDLFGRESMIPAGSACRTEAETGPGTPYRQDARPALQAALQNFDFHEGGSGTLDTVLANSRPDDSITLWHLLFRAPIPERERVYDTLCSRIAPPAGVTREGVLAGNETMLQAWRDRLDLNVTALGQTGRSPKTD